MTTPQRIAIVTGGAQGLGRAVAHHLAAAGCELIIADHEAGHLAQTESELRGGGHAVTAHPLDVRDESAILALYARIDARHGRLDILVNNAGIAGTRAPVESMPLDGWENTVRTNLTSMFLMSRSAIPLMRRHRWGRIVNMSSLSARGQPGVNRSAYVSTKMGVLGLSRALAAEVGADGITVNCVAPSRIRTALTEGTSGGQQEYWNRGAAGSVLGRLGTPEDIAHAVGWLCSDQAAFITGAILDVNGGTMMR